MKHIALEGRCFVLAANQYVCKTDYPTYLQDEITEQPEIMSKGGSVIVSPLGNVIDGPLYNKEGILYACLKNAELIKSRMDFDVTGHYARPDVFNFGWNS